MGVLARFDLSGRVALVTGASRGLGRAFARALAEAGADVALVARGGAATAAAAEEIAAATGRRAVPFVADITDAGAAADLVTAVATTFGRLDVLVNNAGLCFHRPALEVPDSEWDQVFDVNLTALWRLCRLAAPHLAADGGGSIVNVGSISALIVNRPQWQPAYNASKAAVHQLSRSLAAEWAPLGIRVNVLAPGYVKTDMAPVDEPRFRQHWIEDAPLRRYATPEEIAPAVVFLAGDAASFMTGSVLVVDGGYTVF